MSSEKNIRLVQDIYAAFVRGDIRFMTDHIAEDCGDFSIISGASTAVPWHLNGKGKSGAVRFFEAMGSTVEFTAFEPRDYASAGDHVYATLRMTLKIRATGEALELPEVIHRFTFREGKVVRWRGTEDTASTQAAFAGASNGRITSEIESIARRGSGRVEDQ